MSQVSNNQAAQPEVILPDENFWKCYSPHNEFPLSTVCSVFLHAAFVGFILFMGWYVGLYRSGEKAKPLPIKLVAIEGGGGTGGNGLGLGVGPLIPGNTNKTESVSDIEPKKKVIKNKQELKDPVKKKIEIAKTNVPVDDRGFQLLTKKAKQEMELMAKELKSKGNSLPPNLGGSPGTGGGRGGGDGKGIGKGKGPGVGDSKTGVVLTKQQQRAARWSILFNAKSDEDYRQKLQAMRVILWIVYQGRIQRFDFSTGFLQHSTPRNAQDLKKVHWRMDDPSDRGRLARAFNLKYIPSAVALFLPERKEAELKFLERQKAGGVPENLIRRTVFKVDRQANGTFGPIVVYQKLKNGQELFHEKKQMN